MTFLAHTENAAGQPRQAELIKRLVPSGQTVSRKLSKTEFLLRHFPAGSIIRLLITLEKTERSFQRRTETLSLMSDRMCAVFPVAVSLHLGTESGSWQALSDMRHGSARPRPKG